MVDIKFKKGSIKRLVIWDLREKKKSDKWMVGIRKESRSGCKGNGYRG